MASQILPLSTWVCFGFIGSIVFALLLGEDKKPPRSMTTKEIGQVLKGLKTSKEIVFHLIKSHFAHRLFRGIFFSHNYSQGWAPHSFPFGMFRSLKGTFCSFPFFFRVLATYETQKNIPFFPFFSKEWKRTHRTQGSFAKNGKECNVLLQRT